MYIPALLLLCHTKLSFPCSSRFCCCDSSLRRRRHQQLKLAAAAAWLQCVISLTLRSQLAAATASSFSCCFALVLAQLLASELGNKITHCCANQRHFISVIGKAPANSSRYRSSCCPEALGNWGDAERATKSDLAQIGDAIATQKQILFDV